MAIPLVHGGFSEKFEKLRHCPRPGLEPTTERKSEILSNKRRRTSGIATVYLSTLISCHWIPCRHESAVIRGVVAGKPVVCAVIPAIPPVVEVELGALEPQRVHAGVDVDQELRMKQAFKS